MAQIGSGEVSMREILFKAKRLDNGEWVEGYYSKSPHPFSGFIKDFIFAPYYDKEQEVGYDNGYMVDVSTLCQYTGLTDKNGTKIWENDIVRKSDTNALGWIRERNCKVSFDKYGYWKITTEYGDGYWLAELGSEQLEVIGNIFDNPELVGCE